MNSETIAKLKELEAKATAGPWERNGWRVFSRYMPPGGMVIADFAHNNATRNVQNENNAEFYKELRNHARDLIRAAELSEARASMYETEPSAWRVHCPPKHEFDFMVFWDQADAEVRVDEFNADYDPAEWSTKVEPLYAKAEGGSSNG